MPLQRIQCKECQEMLPLAYARTLDRNQMTALLEHLGECPACRALNDQEQILFRLAQADRRGHVLLEDVDSALLDRFARSPEQLTPDQRQAAQQYVADSPHAAEAVELVKKLPHSLDDLMQSQPLPQIEKLESGRAITPRDTTRVTDISPRSWKMWSALAVAATVALIFISQFVAVDSPTIATVQAVFPAATRSVQTMTISVPTSPAVLDAKVYVDPEEDHVYFAEVLKEASETPSYRSEPFAEFDQLGFAVFQTSIETGRYVLKLYDIIEADTLVTEQPFQVILLP